MNVRFLLKWLLGAVLLTLCHSVANAQCTGVFGANQVCGTGSGGGFPGPMDQSALTGLNLGTNGSNVTGTIGNANLTNDSETINGTVCVLGSSCTITTAASAVVVGTTTITGGTPSDVLYDNGGVLGMLSPTITINSTSCSLGSTCSITATASSITVGTTTLISGSANALLAQSTSGATVAAIATCNSGVSITSAAGVPSCSTTIPATTQGNITGTGTLTSGATGSGFTIALTTSTVTGTLGVAHGGTGLTTLTSNTIYKGNSTSAIAVSALTDNGTIVSSSEPIDVTSKSVVIEVANASSTGTTVNALAKLTGAPSTALIAATTDTGGVVGVVIGGAGTTGNAQIAVSGQASCAFDGGTTAGDYVQISPSVGGDCTDAGAYPSSNQVIGRVLSTNASAGTYAIMVFPPEIEASTGGGGGGFISATIIAGTGVGVSGACSSTTSLSCTINTPFSYSGSNISNNNTGSVTINTSLIVTPNVQTTNYSIATTDCGKVVQVGTGTTGFLTVTLPSASGFPSGCVVGIKNGDTTRGKLLSGFPTDLTASNILWPEQYASVVIANSAWTSGTKPGPWTGGIATFYVNHASGSDTSNDCLATGSGACATIQNAQLLSCSNVYSPKQNITIQVANETFTESPNIGNTESCTSAYNIYGNTSTPASVVWKPATATFTGTGSGTNLTTSSVTGTIGIGFLLAGTGVPTGTYIVSQSFGPSGGAGIYVTSQATTSSGASLTAGASFAYNCFDDCFTLVSGFTVQATVPGQTGLIAGKRGFVEAGNMIYGAFSGGIHIQANYTGYFNCGTGTYQITGNAIYHWENLGGTIVCQGSTINIPSALAFTSFTYGNGNAKTVLSSTSFTGTGSGSGSTGYQFTETQNSSIQLNGITLPGATAGTLATNACQDTVCSTYGYLTGNTPDIGPGNNYCGVATCGGGAANSPLIYTTTTGTLKNLHVGSSTSPGAGQTYTIAIFFSGSEQVVQCTISGAVANSCNDTTDTVRVPANTVVFMFVGNSAGAANSSFGYTVELDAP